MTVAHLLVKKSINAKIYRSIGLVLIGVVLSYALVIIGLISIGMEHGSRNVADRMGADLIVVPKGNKTDMERLLLTATKNYFYMNKSVLKIISQTKGVEKISPQTFLMTMEASCCDQQVQIIGIDMETDFTITPWIDKKYLKSLEMGQIIAGSKVAVKDGKHFMMFGKKFQVASTLKESGSSMDETIFVNRNMMGELLKYAKAAGQGVVKEVTSDDISAVMIKAENEKDIQTITARLATIKDVDVVSKDYVSGKLTTGLRDMYIPVTIVTSLLVFVTVLLLYIIYYIILRDRKKEVEVLRTIGMSRKKVKRLLRNEILLLSFVGAAIGTTFGGISFFVLFGVIDNISKIPFTLPLVSEDILVFIFVLILTTALGPLCSAVNIKKVCPEEIIT